MSTPKSSAAHTLQNMELREFTQARFEQVRNEWRDAAGVDEFTVELGPMFEWAEQHLSPTPGDSMVFELRNVVTDKCLAIADIVDTETRMSKLLKLHLTPEIWSLEGTEKVQNVALIYMSAYTCVITKGIDKRVRQVKIYGRNDFMLKVLRSLHAGWSTDDLGLHASMQGRWLVVTNETESV